MGRKKQTRHLNVYLNGTCVGFLIKQFNGSLTFQYGEDWLEHGFAISNSLPLREDEYKGDVVARYFDNLLPDNDELRKTVATKFGAESIRAFDMLEVIGRDCVGALSFLPEKMDSEVNFKMEYAVLSEKEIARRIKGLGSLTPLGMDHNNFRISIAGAQEKTAFLNIDGQWCEPYGLTPTTHIFKAAIGALNVNLNFNDSIDNEWACLFLMKKLGFPSCEAEIHEFEDQRVLVVKRFDRVWKNYRGKKTLLRLPQEDLCQSLSVSPYKKYESEGGPGVVDIAQFLMASKDLNDRLKFFKSLMIFDLFYAPDGHAKNFSIFLEQDGFRLTPFYDVMSGYFLNKREKMPIRMLKLAMKIGNSGYYDLRSLTKRHYAESAQRCGINQSVFEQLTEELRESFQGLTISDSELDPSLNHETLEIILEGMKKRAAVIF